ncbi:unnamed protein product [Chilo suppressalis]|uniref:FLYWCH-type domain-containing protein n=1 Tax=Chilo suppressalis TaxID=168631 RepID=A0ABN8AY13_CHISP|nr:unnamed protein product [Chilo suppressalis]
MFIMSKQGSVLLCVGGFTFRKHRQRSNKTRWNCSSHKNCKAVVYTSDDTNEIMKCNNVHNHPIRFISDRIHLNKKRWAFNIARRAPISQEEDLHYMYIPAGHKKNLIMFRGYTFSHYGKNLWYCSKIKLGCKAKLKLDDKERIISAHNTHCHEPPVYCVTDSGEYILVRLSFKYIQTPKRKNPILMLGEYTFTQTTSDQRYWNCSKKLSTFCPAKLRFNSDGKLVDYKLTHNHSPPNYVVTKDGNYIKF